MSADVFIVGKVNLNNPKGSKEDKSPFIEIILDTADGRADGEVILMKQISNEDNDYYTKKVGRKRKYV